MVAVRALAVALAGALLVVIGLAFGTSALLVPGVAFGIIGLLTPPLVWLQARGAGVRREVDRRDVAEDERLTCTVTVTVGRVGLAGAELVDPLGAEPVAVRLGPSLRARREIQFALPVRFARRGRKHLPPPELRVSDPVGLATLTRRGSGACTVLVLPRTEAVSWSARRGIGRCAPDDRTMADSVAACEVDGLRPYRPGTPASRIHWAALARGAGLLERRLRAEPESRPLVILDARCDADEPQLLDAAVRAAASLVLELARGEGCGLLTAGSRRPLEIDHRLGGWSAARARLALLDPAERPPVLGVRPPTAMLFYVAARAVGRPPQALQDRGGVLVVPAPVAAGGPWPVVLQVAGCVGYGLAPRFAGPGSGGRGGGGLVGAAGSEGR